MNDFAVRLRKNRVLNEPIRFHCTLIQFDQSVFPDRQARKWNTAVFPCHTGGLLMC